MYVMVEAWDCEEMLLVVGPLSRKSVNCRAGLGADRRPCSDWGNETHGVRMSL